MGCVHSWLQWAKVPGTRTGLSKLSLVKYMFAVFAKAGPGVLEIGGDVHPVEDARPAPQHRVGGELIGKSQTRSKIVSIHRRVAMAGVRKHRGSLDFPDLPKLRERSRGIAIHWNADSRVPREIAELKPVVAFAIWRAPLVAQAKIDGQLGRDLPVILHVEGGLFRLVGHRGNDVQRGIVGDTRSGWWRMDCPV